MNKREKIRMIREFDSQFGQQTKWSCMTHIVIKNICVNLGYEVPAYEYIEDLHQKLFNRLWKRNKWDTSEYFSYRYVAREFAKDLSKQLGKTIRVYIADFDYLDSRDLFEELVKDEFILMSGTEKSANGYWNQVRNTGILDHTKVNLNRVKRWYGHAFNTIWTDTIWDNYPRAYKKYNIYKVKYMKKMVEEDHLTSTHYIYYCDDETNKKSNKIKKVLNRYIKKNEKSVYIKKC